MKKRGVKVRKREEAVVNETKRGQRRKGRFVQIVQNAKKIKKVKKRY